MNSIAVLDHERFDNFLENKETGATVFTDEENLPSFGINKIIEVQQYSSCVEVGNRHLAIVVEKPSKLPNEANIFKIKVCKIGKLN